MKLNKRLMAALILAIYSLISPRLFGRERMNRMGVGFSQQFKNNIPALSVKFQRSKSFSLGGVFALDTTPAQGGIGVGIKVYRNIFDEPRGNFYASLLGAIISQKTATDSNTGFQFDFTLGSEFSFNGLESIGVSFEMGLSLNKLKDFAVQTVGHQFVTAGIHFYL